MFILFLTVNALVTAQEIPSEATPIPAEKPQPTKAQEEKKEIPQKVEIPLKAVDTTENDSVKKPKSFLEYRIESTAKDYKRIDRKRNTITLYNEAKIVYGDITIEAGKIVINNNTGDVFAYGITVDSLGYTQKPVFSQGTNVVKPDSIIFNKDSQKALTYNSETTQGEFNVLAETTKKVNDSVFYMENARFTTSKDPKNPEYYFYARKIKFVPKKKIVTGLVNMYIADVPTPLGLPFAFFPMTNERKSGVILPSFGNNNSQGYFLQNGGYYFAVNDYLDLTLLGDYFTNGSYGARVESNYKVRYKFNGSFRFLYENQLQSERGFSDFAQTSRYNINWQHSQDPKSNPNSRFSASVNLGSSQFFRQSFNQVNQSATLVNNLSSSVTYSKTFPGEPQVNISASATHNQNTNTNVVNLTLPTLQGSISRMFPFAPKEGTKKGAFQNINLQYNLRGENRITTTDEDFLSENMFDNAIMGLQHSIPVATNFKLGYFSVSANANFEENWVFETFRQTLEENDNGVFNTVRDTISGFAAYRTYSYGASVGTTIYGSWKSKNPESKIQAVRHIIRPNISYSANPSFDQYYDRLVTEQGLDAPGREEQFYSRFDGTLFGAPGRVFSSSINLGVQNNIEAKVRDRDSTKTELKKIQILKTLSFNTAYNLAGDSLNWSPLQVRGVIPITKNIDINLDANFDPYALDNNNNRINTFNINNGGSLFRLTRAGFRTSFRLSSKDFEKTEDKEDKQSQERTLENGGRDDGLFGESVDYSRDQSQEVEKQDVNIKKDRYRFKIPWNLNFAYTMTYINAQRQNMINQQSLMVSGDVELSPRWSIGGNTGYDFANKGISFSTIRFQRDLESFTMSFNWTPIGPQNSWFFFIGIKASALSDIKWDQRRQPDPTF
ncbi:lipopolysaccharide assembly outer membrane protein LptD (OstA) [Nonlabens dokdonensis]|uniref:Organic solvent tolerance protein OstA-like protein n=2 Tax=Nonlabens dokdonensis TaxID=328515 RepID=L7WGX6_NONDD|nr:putative LPS assembly protein LptD [Nonlabens dokdonensis]AGC78203.1 organic solvent tolerance protein OstA-like protein [Nonlabens dokdonensis DSW-6]PZX37904.1 lipopolysaccharide assembly outer membrane protein LptD (OstA) [Nonlabens dokdonensis]